MIIQYMKLDGFRRYENIHEIIFDSNETYITGGNFKGKSTIVMAVIWCILGTNMYGNSKECLINHNRNECTVQLDFIDNKGNNHTLVRYKERHDSKNNFVMLDGQFVRQQDLIEFYHDAPLLLSIMNPEYFRDLEPMKQRDIINKYLPDISLETVIKKLSADEQAKINIPHKNIKLYIRDREIDIKEMQEDIKNMQGKIDYATKIAFQTLDKSKEFTKQDELELLYQEQDIIKQNSKSNLKWELQNQIADKQAQSINIISKINKVQEKGMQSRIDYEKIASSPSSLCSTCSQELNSVTREVALNSKKKEMYDLADEKKALGSELEELKNAEILLTTKLNAIAEVSSMRKLEDVEKDISILEQEKKEIDIFNNELVVKEKNIKTAEADIKSLQEKIKMLETEIEETKILVDIAKRLYFMTIQEKMVIAKQYMPNADIKFYELIKSTRRIKRLF